MTTSYAGHYPIETRDGEIERLRLQSAAMAPDSLVMLDRIGVAPGWHCLDIGCGPGGVTDLLGARVGTEGRVVGLDMNERFPQHARANAPDSVEFRLGDAFGSELPAETFDLVHMRFVASTAGSVIHSPKSTSLQNGLWAPNFVTNLQQRGDNRISQSANAQKGSS